MTNQLPFLSHESIFFSLMQMLKIGRLPHALLFTGPEGIGKQLVARHLATALLCKETPNICGVCSSCKIIVENKHPDFLLLQPEENRIKIEAVRELKKDLAFSPFMGSRRVVLINDAHTMNTAAANALLKTLEEPPADTYFILISHAQGWLPKTIASRCQKIRFSPLPDSLVKEISLSPSMGEERGGSDSTNISPKILHWAQGSPLRALQFSQLEGEVVPLEKLISKNKPLSFDQAYDQTLNITAEDKLPLFLEALLLETHQSLTQPKADQDSRFDLLTFADRILEIRKNLRLNINPKIQLTRLLMYFQEPLKTRL